VGEKLKNFEYVKDDNDERCQVQQVDGQGQRKLHVRDVEADVVTAVDQVGCSHEDRYSRHVVSGKARFGNGPAFASKKNDRDGQCFEQCTGGDEDHQEVLYVYSGASAIVTLRSVKSIGTKLQKF